MKQLCLGVFLLVTVAVRPVAAQAPPGNWEVTIAPYLLGASMKGTLTLHGTPLEAEVSASDILSNLEFGLMGVGAARKGKWGFGGDALWMQLGKTIDQPPGKIDFNQGAFAFYGLRRLSGFAELTFGARVNVLQGKMKFEGPLQANIDQKKTWVDPLVGLILKTPVKKRMSFRVYTEIGGFGAGSDFAWQVFPTVDITLHKKVLLDLGYRWIGMDYTHGDGNQQFGYDMVIQGPLMGVTFRF